MDQLNICLDEGVARILFTVPISIRYSESIILSMCIVAN